MRYHVKMDKLLQKEAKVTKVPDDTYGESERERERERARERERERESEREREREKERARYKGTFVTSLM